MSFFTIARTIRAPLMAFFAMGIFWGAWHALVPDVKIAVGADDGALGLALLCVALGAVPAMVLGGRLVDRIEPGLLPATVLAFGVAAVLPGLAGSPVELGAALFVLGLASGMMDVVMNARIGAIEAATGVRAMHMAHALFAVVYLVVALGTGAARDAALDPPVILTSVGAAIVALGLVTARLGREDRIARPDLDDVTPDADGLVRRRIDGPVLLLGIIAFAAFLSENGWQSWSALFLERTFEVDPWLGSMGPAVVGTALAVGRFGGQALAMKVSDAALIAGAAIVAIAGGTAMALAPSPIVVFASLFVAAAGASVIAPSALSLAGRTAEPRRRGAAVATVGVIAYTGFFVGPAMLGFVADAAGLRTALGMIAVVLAFVIPCLLVHHAWSDAYLKRPVSTQRKDGLS